MSKRPLLAVGLFAFLTALLSTKLSMTAVTVLCVIASFVLIGAMIFRRYRFAKPMAFAAVGVILVGTVFVVKLCTVVYPQTAYDGSRVTLTTRVIEETSSKGVYLVETVAGELEDGIRMTMPLFNENLDPRPGDLLSGEMTLTARDDSYARARNAYLTAMTEHVTWTDGSDTLSSSTKLLYSWRSYIHELWYRHLPFDSAAVCDAITIGNRSCLSDELHYEYRVAGIYHMLCVSGMHLSVLSGVLLWVLRNLFRLRDRTAAVITMVGVVLFAALCGFSASVTRSMVMMLIVLASMLFRRRADGLNSLGLSAALLLLCDPFAVYDLGFLLTFASTFGILMILPAWDREITDRLAVRFPKATVIVRPLSMAVGVSVSAVLCVQPIVSLYFGTFSTWFLVGNLLCSAAATVLMVMCMAAVLFSLVWIPATEVLTAACDLLCRYMTACADMITAWPMAVLPADGTAVIVWQFLLPAVIMLAYHFRRMIGAVTAVAVMVIVFAGVYVTNAFLSRDTVTIIPVPADNTAVIIEAPDSIGLIFEGDGESLTASAQQIRAMGHDDLDWLIWLGHGGAQVTDTSGMTLPIAHLMTVDETHTYLSLPDAKTVTALEKECTVSIGESRCINRTRGWFELVCGDTVVMIADEFSDAADLTERQRRAQAVVLSEYVPYNAHLLDSENTVVFCKYAFREDWKTNFEQPFYFAAEVSKMTTDGNGEIVLQTE